MLRANFPFLQKAMYNFSIMFYNEQEELFCVVPLSLRRGHVKRKGMLTKAVLVDDYGSPIFEIDPSTFKVPRGLGACGYDCGDIIVIDDFYIHLDGSRWSGK